MNVTVVGTQLGDEGKGGVVDVFGSDADIVVRYQGGDNAGHTVVHDGDKYKLSLVPSGAVRGKVNVLGNGCVINLETLFEEIDTLRGRGLDPDVRVAERAHVILPHHRLFDGIEEAEKEDLAAGTTKRGIGPTYEDKAGRRGVRVGDLLDADLLHERLKYVLDRYRQLATDVYGREDLDAFDVDTIYGEFRAYGERLADEGMVIEAGQFLDRRIRGGDNVLFEGAQGTSLDIDHGIYPFVTSSNSSAGGACTGTGLGPTIVGDGEILGIVKAYLSRVGTGPLPTELGGVEGQTPSYDPDADDPSEELARYLRDEGGEYGTVTGRPRRVGWLDMPMLRHARTVNGLTGIVVNHLDVLAGLDEVKVGHTYTLNGEDRRTIPSTTALWGTCEAEYRTFDGWDTFDSDEVVEEGYEGLPENARTYLQYISDELDVPIYAVGVGPDREHTIICDDPFA